MVRQDSQRATNSPKRDDHFFQQVEQAAGRRIQQSGLSNAPSVHPALRGQASLPPQTASESIEKMSKEEDDEDKAAD
jgi:hypothetical protein